MTTVDKLKPYRSRIRGNTQTQFPQGETSGPVPNVSVLAIKKNVFQLYFTFSLLLFHLGESCIFGSLSQEGQKEKEGGEGREKREKERERGGRERENQNNIIMAGVGMAGNLCFSDMLLEQF